MARNSKSNAKTETTETPEAPPPGRGKKPTFKKAEFTLVNKLSTKNLGDALKVLADPEGTRLLMGTIVGVASSYQEGSSDKGDYVALLGTFEAIPADPSKQRVRSGKCFLPGTVVGQIMAGIDTGGAVQFALEIVAKRVDRRDSPVGYVWEVRPLIESDDDPLTALVSQIGNLPMLPAPATE